MHWLNGTLKKSSDYCCPGLVNSNGKCSSLGVQITPAPEFIVDETNAENCSFSVNFAAGHNKYCLGAEQWSSRSDCEKEYHKVTYIDPQTEQEEEVCTVNGEIVNIDVSNCFGGIWSENIGVKIPYLYYTRLFEGLQWLWA